MSQCGNPGRQIPARKRPRLPDRHAGAGAPADDAAPARPGRRPQHRRLHFRLSRLAARRLRPGAVAGQALHQEATTSSSSPASTRTSRRPPCGAPSRSISIPAPGTMACSACGTARGPGVDRSGDALKHANYAGTSQARRHRGAGRRRPHGQVVDDGAPERARLHGRRHPGHPCRQRSRSISISACMPSPCRATRACGSASRC